MTDIEALITTARRYCLENHSFWSKKYQLESSGNNNPYSKNDYNIFPRYNALKAILQGVERIVGSNYESLEICKTELEKIGKESHTIFTINGKKEIPLLGSISKYFGTTGKHNRIEKKAIEEERNKFIEFINSQTKGTLQEVAPLDFQRILSEKESELIRKNLKDVWNYDGDYWEPLEKKSSQATTFLMTENISESDKSEIEKTIRQNLKTDRLFVITEDRIDYEIEGNLLDIDLYESIICDSNFDWVVYGSHESTVAFGGDFLVSKLNSLFAERKDKLNKWEQNW